MSAFTDLLADQFAEKRFLVVLEPYDTGTSTVKTIYLSSHGFNSKPTDTPANQHYTPRLKKAYSFKRALFEDGRVSGRTVPGYGDIVINNQDGGLDYLYNYAWGGRRVRVWMGGEGFNLADFGLIFTGTAQGLSWSDEEITVELRSLEYMFDRECQTNTFAGTGGVEGTDVLKGKRKPRGYGFVQIAEPEYLGVVGGKNSFRLGDNLGVVYVQSVWDKGSPLTYATGVPVAGEWNYTEANGVITIGGSFDGPLTATFVGRSLASVTSTNSITTGTAGLTRNFTVPSTTGFRVGMMALAWTTRNHVMVGRVTAISATNIQMLVESSRGTQTVTGWVVQSFGTPAQIMKQFAVDMGVTSFDDPGIAAFTAFLPTTHYPDCGYYIPEGGNGLEIIDDMADGLGAWWGFNRAGQFTLGALGKIGQLSGSFDSPLPTVEYGPTQIIEIQREPTEEPSWSISLRYDRIWRVHSSGEVVPTVTNRDAFTQEYSTLIQETSGILTSYPLSKPMTVDALYTSGDTSFAAAILELGRLFYLFSSRKDYFRVTLKAQPLLLELGQTVKITHPRYGLSGGKNLFVVAINEMLEGDNYSVELGLWG